MKKYILPALCISLLACNNSNTKSVNTSTTRTTDSITLHDTAVLRKNSPIIEAYRAYLNTLDTNDAASCGKAVAKYRSMFDKTDTSVNDSAYAVFDHYCTCIVNGLNERYADHWPIDTVEPEKYAVLPSEIALINQLKTNGFKFAASEGVWYIATDRDSILKWFSSSVSQAMKIYLNKVSIEENEGYQEDGAIIIEITALADRAVWWERFNNSYPRFAMNKETVGQYKFYLTELMRGESNTPAVDWDSKAITSDFKKGYSHLFLKYPKSNTARLVRPYFDALLQKDTSKAELLLDQYKDQKVTLW